MSKNDPAFPQSPAIDSADYLNFPTQKGLTKRLWMIGQVAKMFDVGEVMSVSETLGDMDFVAFGTTVCHIADSLLAAEERTRDATESS